MNTYKHKYVFDFYLIGLFIASYSYYSGPQENLLGMLQAFTAECTSCYSTNSVKALTE